MSRNLYTIAVVAPDLARDLRRLHRERRGDWFDSAGERLLAAAIDDASAFMAATRCPAVLLHRTLGASFDDPAFNPHRSRRATP